MLGRLTPKDIDMLSSLKAHGQFIKLLETKLEESNKRLKKLSTMEEMFREQGHSQLLEDLLSAIYKSSK